MGRQQSRRRARASCRRSEVSKGCRRASPPAHRADKLTGALWCAYRIGEIGPRTPRQRQAILATKNNNSKKSRPAAAQPTLLRTRSATCNRCRSGDTWCGAALRAVLAECGACVVRCGRGAEAMAAGAAAGGAHTFRIYPNQEHKNQVGSAQGKGRARGVRRGRGDRWEMEGQASRIDRRGTRIFLLCRFLLLYFYFLFYSYLLFYSSFYLTST
jgi:hypothetical protein